MIGTIDVEVQSANPKLPLYPIRAFVNSPSSVRVRNVPTEIGAWKITAVRIVVAYPDSSIKTADCVLAGSVWVATVAGCAVSGTSENGFTVFASGVDENGNAVANYVLGKGDIEILQADGTLAPDAPAYYVKLFDEAPDVPKEGYAYISGGTLYIYDGTAWTAIGGDPSDDPPLMDGTASPGESADYSRGDHVHPHDAEKLDGAAAYEAWESGIPYPAGAVVSHNGRLWFCLEPNTPDEPSVESSDWEMRTIHSLKQDALSSAQLAAANSGATAAKVATWDGYAAQIAAKASLTDLPYAMVTPGEWEFSGVPEGHTITEGPYFQDGDGWIIVLDDVTPYYSDEMSESAMSLTWHYDADGATITATRASLPGHLLDRAGNRVVVTGDTTLTLPALVNAGKARDFLVKVTTSADDLNITWQGQGSEAPNGADELQFVTEDGDFPVVGEAGTYLFSFTEVEAHTFAVSMKTLVAAPQAQGGS